MGTLMSPVLQVDQINFKPFPTGRGVKNINVVRVFHDLYGVKNKAFDGVVYTNSSLHQNKAYLPADWPFCETAMRALVNLGALDKRAADAHTAVSLARSELRRFEESMDYGVERFEDLGPKMTKAQERAMKTKHTKLKKALNDALAAARALNPEDDDDE